MEAAITTTLVVRAGTPADAFTCVGHFPSQRRGGAAGARRAADLPPAVKRATGSIRPVAASPANPLTARVPVNRPWQRYFGLGLVATENDFGTQGPPPTHPELLDWLAAESVAREWALKAMHRLIVTSATYRQWSATREDAGRRRPATSCWHGSRGSAGRGDDSGRLPAGGGRLLMRTRSAGPPVYPPQPEGIYRFTQHSERGGRREGGGSVPPRDVHVVLAVEPASDHADVRRAGREFGAARGGPLQHAAAGADAGQRPGVFEIAQGMALRAREAPVDDDDARLSYDFRCAVGLAIRSRRSWNGCVSCYRRSALAYARNADAAVALVPYRCPPALSRRKRRRGRGSRGCCSIWMRRLRGSEGG